MTRVRFCGPGGKMPLHTAGKMPAATIRWQARMRRYALQRKVNDNGRTFQATLCWDRPVTTLPEGIVLLSCLTPKPAKLGHMPYPVSGGGATAISLTRSKMSEVYYYPDSPTGKNCKLLNSCKLQTMEGSKKRFPQGEGVGGRPLLPHSHTGNRVGGVHPAVRTEHIPDRSNRHCFAVRVYYR